MPEGPSIVYLRNKIVKFIGKKVVQVEGTGAKFDIKRLLDLPVVNIRTYGKELLICFPDFFIRVHFGLFGSYTIDSAKPGKLRLGIGFDSGNLNLYAANVTLIEKDPDEVYKWSTDVMHETWDRDKALSKLKRIPKEIIADALLDQNIFAGVGNRIKDDILFRQHVQPESLVGSIPGPVLLSIIDEAVKYSFEYQSWKEKGIEKEKLEVHRKKTCTRDKSPLTQMILGKSKRSTYFCKVCQKLYK